MKLDEMFDLIYCINLDRRTDRWELAQKEFEKIGISPKRFSAIEDPIPFMGCRKSHIAILKEALEKNANVLIFEDDVQFINLENGTKFVENALEDLRTDAWWNMFYLGGNVLKPFYQVTNNLARLTHCQSTHAYGVHRDFLKRLISFIEPDNYILDVLYADGVIPYNNCYITVPMFAIQRSDYSDIEKREMTYDIPCARYEHFLVKKGIQTWR